MGALDDVMRWAASRAEERSTNQMGLFGSVGGFDTPPPLPEAATWHADDELRAERDAIGFFITGHPLDRYAQDLRRFTNVTIGTLRTRGPELPPGPERHGRPDPRPRVRVGGVIHTVKLRNSKKGDRYATFVIEDREGVVEVIAWPDTYRKHEAIVRSGEPVVILGALEISAERCQIIAEELTPLAEARADSISQVHVRVDLEVGRDLLATLRQVFEGHPGPCDAFLHLMREDHSETVLALPDTLRVAASEQIVNAVEAILGSGVLSFR